MKKIILAVMAAVLLAASAVAQPARRPHHPMDRSAKGLGLTFGYVHSSYRTTDWATDEVVTSGGLDGFVAGINKDFRIIPRALYFQVGLNYMYQNDERNETVMLAGFDTGIRVVGDRTEHYLGLPLRLKYTVPVTDRIGLSIDAGPTLLMGLSSNMRYRTRFTDGVSTGVTYNIYKAEMDTENMKGDRWDIAQWVNDSGMLPEGRLQRGDIMMGAAIGADFFNLMEVRLGYDWGMINRYKKTVTEDLKMHRGQFTLSVGVRF